MESSEWDIPHESEKKIKRMKIFISIFLGVIGILIIISQAIPLTSSYIRGEIEILKQKLLKDPVTEEYKQYIEDELAYYDPGISYFENLSLNAEGLQYQGQFSYDPTTKKNKEIKVDREYDKPMYITISDIGISNILVSPNVDSSNEAVYDQYLKKGIAHFKGTPLPGDGGNSFLYGHSAIISFFNGHNNLPETIFTKLEDADIGDKVVIKKDNNDIQYVVKSKKIVSPEDYTILQSQGSKETVTMMTCWPSGVGTKRLVVVAERI